MTSTMAVIASATILAGALWASPALAQRGDFRIRHQVTGGPHTRHQVAGGPHTRHQVTGGRHPSMPAHPIATPPGPSRPGHSHPGFGHHHHHGGHGKRWLGGSGPIVLYSPGYAYASPGYAYGSPAYPAPRATTGTTRRPPPRTRPPTPGRPRARSPWLPRRCRPWSSTRPDATSSAGTGRRLRTGGCGFRILPRHRRSRPRPAAVTAQPPPPPRDEPQPRRSTLYRWTDRDGVVHLTDNASSVPPEYRAKAGAPSL